MILSGLALLAATAIRLLGLDRAGISFCYFKALTGYACFTCGSTRAFGYLSRFDVAEAFSIQPLVTSALLGLLVWGAFDAFLSLSGRRTVMRMEGRATRWFTAAVVALATLNWFYLLATGV